MGARSKIYSTGDFVLKPFFRKRRKRRQRNRSGVVHVTTLLYRTIDHGGKSPRSGRFWELLNLPQCRKMLICWEISKFLENPHFLAPTHMVIHFKRNFLVWALSCKTLRRRRPPKMDQFSASRDQFAAVGVLPPPNKWFGIIYQAAGGFSQIVPRTRIFANAKIRVYGMGKIARRRSFFVSPPYKWVSINSVTHLLGMDRFRNYTTFL